MDINEMFSIGLQWAITHEDNLNLTKPHLPKMVVTYHNNALQIKTNSYKHSYHFLFSIDLHSNFSIGSQCGNKHEIHLNLIPPKLVMTDHDHSHTNETNTP